MSAVSSSAPDRCDDDVVIRPLHPEGAALLSDFSHDFAEMDPGIGRGYPARH